MPALFFLIVLPALQWTGYLLFLLFAGAIIASYVKQCIVAFYRAKAAYMATVFAAPAKDSDPTGLNERVSTRK